MVAESLELTVAADADAAAGAQDAVGDAGDRPRGILLFHKPATAAADAERRRGEHATTRLLRELLVRREALQLRFVVRGRFRRVPVVLGERPAIRHEQRWGVRDARLREGGGHVLEQREDR